MSWHIMWCSLGILIGAAIAPATQGIFVSTHWLVIAVSLLFVVCVKRLRYFALAAVVGGGLVGLWRGSEEYTALKSYLPHYGKIVQIEGVIGEDTSFGPKGDQRLRITDVRIANKHLPGAIWVSTESDLQIKRGDIVLLTGMLHEGFGNIPASMFRVQVESVTRPYPGDIGRRVRDWFAVGVERAVPGVNAQFALAYLVGQKLNMPDALNEQLKTVGLIHAVVASGAHLTILIGAVRRLFVGVSKYLTAFFSIGMISSFILITGFSPSMTRAGLVSLLGLAAWYYGRVLHPFVLLPFAAALTILYNPAYVWGDVGWYLSFTAFGGVLILAPLLHHYFWGKDRRPSLLREVLVATIAAQLVTLPITIYAFGYYSIYALLANVLVVPLVPLTMLLTFIVGVIGLLLPFAAGWAGEPLALILDYMKVIVSWLANLPGARSEITIGVPLLVSGYVLTVVVTVYLWHVTRHDFRQDTAVQRDF